MCDDCSGFCFILLPCLICRKSVIKWDSYIFTTDEQLSIWKENLVAYLTVPWWDLHGDSEVQKSHVTILKNPIEIQTEFPLPSPSPVVGDNLLRGCCEALAE
jgi:hypothetical protein